MCVLHELDISHESFTALLPPLRHDLHLTLATSPVNNKTQALARFCLGSYLRTPRLIPVNLRAPVYFLLPTHYVQLQKLRHFKLEKEAVTVLTKHGSLLSLVQEREPMCTACYR